MSALLDSLLPPSSLADCRAHDDEPRRFIARDPIVEGLTESQRVLHHAMLEAMRAGQLRPLPTCFGDL